MAKDDVSKGTKETRILLLSLCVPSTRVIPFLFYSTARLRRVDPSHRGQHRCRHHSDFCRPHKVPTEQDTGEDLTEQPCLSKQECIEGRGLGEEMSPESLLSSCQDSVQQQTMQAIGQLATRKYQARCRQASRWDSASSCSSAPVCAICLEEFTEGQVGCYGCG